MYNKFELTSFKDQEQVFRKLFDRAVSLELKIPGASKTEVLTHYNSGDRNDMPYFTGILCHMADGSYVISLRADVWTEAKFRGVEFKELKECGDIWSMQNANGDILADFIGGGDFTGYITFRFGQWADVVHFFWNACEMFDTDPGYDGWSVFYGKYCDDCSTPIEDAESIQGADAEPFEAAAEQARNAYSAEMEADCEA